jgi:hypothetical protein
MQIAFGLKVVVLHASSPLITLFEPASLGCQVFRFKKSSEGISESIQIDCCIPYRTNCRFRNRIKYYFARDCFRAQKICGSCCSVDLDGKTFYCIKRTSNTVFVRGIEIVSADFTVLWVAAYAMPILSEEEILNKISEYEVSGIHLNK